MRKCEYCGSYIPDDSYACSGCGAKSAPVKQELENEKSGVEQLGGEISNFGRAVNKKLSDKKVMNALLLFIVTIAFGFLGIHRFMQRKIITGIIWMCSGGLFFVGYAVDSAINFVHMLGAVLHSDNK